MPLILGIDPGSRITGFALIEIGRNKERCVQAGCLRLERVPMEKRLGVLLESCQNLLTQFQPEILSIEQAFMYKNAHTALKLGQVRGIVIAVAQAAKLAVYEYAPRLIKQAVTGTGSADKQQVQHMVQSLLGLSKCPQSDCADAMAVALCHAAHARVPLAMVATRSKRAVRKNRRWTESDCQTVRNIS
jgi:crossover junction endodeoxyribonuclease RuvC